MRANEVLSKDEIQSLLKISDLRGLSEVLITWGVIFGSFYLVSWKSNILTIFIAIYLIGGRQLALAILMHDAAHFALFNHKKINDFIGQWFCAAPVWHSLPKYRVHHLAHHKYAGSEQDPDYSLVKGFPITRLSLIRKFARDLFGISGIKRIFAQLLMDFGYLKYTVAANVEKDTEPRSLFSRFTYGLINFLPFLISNIALYFILSYLGLGSVYYLWPVAYLTTFSLFVRIRSIAEHACTDMDLHPVKSTRTTYANIFARLSVAPHHVNYHLEHHFLMTVPSYRFPEFHKILKERGVYQDGHLAQGYFEVLKSSYR